ncbi:hypothetical protein AALP_AA6G137700 [Arabis alpina]|uniref:Uncharacterized protein n=1 Tax=Arabis alpina TaxID=50452 RepID=A0A087GP28_ARAAL|nr:hypothetical protein AALP_AA6G137700 [Arabis alpina]
MGTKTSSKFGQFLIVLLLLCTFLCRTGSALPSALPSAPNSRLITGRRMMAMGTGPSKSGRGGGGAPR